MSSAERLQPQSEVIEYLEQGKALIPHPAELGDEKLTGILAESIFLTSSPVRIISVYGNILDEINPEKIDWVRTLYKSEDVYTFIAGKAKELSWADEVVIETMESDK
jgi:hypothetical protein